MTEITTNGPRRQFVMQAGLDLSASLLDETDLLDLVRVVNATRALRGALAAPESEPNVDRLTQLRERLLYEADVRAKRLVPERTEAEELLVLVYDHIRSDDKAAIEYVATQVDTYVAAMLAAEEAATGPLPNEEVAS